MEGYSFPNTRILLAIALKKVLPVIVYFPERQSWNIIVNFLLDRPDRPEL
jgi:hypothetical protein